MAQYGTVSDEFIESMRRRIGMSRAIEARTAAIMLPAINTIEHWDAYRLRQEALTGYQFATGLPQEIILNHPEIFPLPSLPEKKGGLEATVESQREKRAV
ncbi:MAG: hypothetical protein QW331_01670 [Candidatus Woesearchaeota archaeon]